MPSAAAAQPSAAAVKETCPILLQVIRTSSRPLSVSLTAMSQPPAAKVQPSAAAAILPTPRRSTSTAAKSRLRVILVLPSAAAIAPRARPASTSPAAMSQPRQTSAQALVPVPVLPERPPLIFPAAPLKRPQAAATATTAARASVQAVTPPATPTSLSTTA